MRTYETTRRPDPALRITLAIVLATLLGAGAVLTLGCAGNPAPILVGQSGLAVAESIGKLQVAGKQLTDAAILPPAVALGFQEQLLAVNEKLKPLPDILRTIDRLQQAEQGAASDTDKAIALLTVAGQDISVVIGGVPLAEGTKVLIDLIRAAQAAVQGVLVEVAKIRGRE